MKAKLNPVQQAIESRKRADVKYREMDAVLTEERKVLNKAQFEVFTANKIEQRIKKDTVEQRVRDHEFGLVKRRQMLAAIYEEEMKSWTAELLNRVETVEERKARIMEKAFALRDARESARKKYVQDALDAQWRDACDDARTLDARAMDKWCGEERIRQLEAKRQRGEDNSADERAFLEEWNRQLEAIEAKDKAKKDNAKYRAAETQKGVLLQMEHNEKMKQEHYNRTLAEDEDEIRRIREAIAEDDTIQKRRSDDARARGAATVEYNKVFKEIEAEEKAKDQRENEILLEYALRKEREQIAREEAKKNAAKNAAMEFRRYLEEQMVREAEDTAFVDEINKREEEKVWKARDDALKAREDARQQLMQHVNEGRQQQLKAKAEREIKEKEEGKIFASKFIVDAKEGIERERQDAERRRQIAADNNVRLQQQIDLRRHHEELLKQEQYLEDKRMKYIERQHRERLALQGGQIRTNFALKANNWYT